MCGILGLISYKNSALTHLQSKVFRRATRGLLTQSEIRGTNASGLAILTDKRVTVFKNDMAASRLVQTPGYSNIIKSLNRTDTFKAMIGHTRHKTKGHQRFNVNNHPIVANRIIGVHNGMICNDDHLFDKYADLIDRKGRVDSEIIFRLIDYHRRKGETLVESVKNTCSKIVGSYTCAFIDAEEPAYITIFGNSSYVNACIFIYDSSKAIAFASADYILRKALRENSMLDPSFSGQELEVRNNGFRIDMRTGKIFEFDIEEKKRVVALNSMQRSLQNIRGFKGDVDISGTCTLRGTEYYKMSECCDKACSLCPYYSPL